MSLPYKPEKYQNAIPYFMVTGTEAFIDFLKATFNGELTEALRTKEGAIQHAEVRIGDSTLMIGASQDGSTTSNMIYLYVPSVDDAYKKALSAGAESVMEPEDQFYGDRNAGVRDPFGQTWWLSSQIEEVSGEEVQKRMQDME